MAEGVPLSAARRGPIATFVAQLGSLTAGRGVALLLSGVWAVVAARHLTPAEFGDLSLLLAVGSICMVFGDLGLQVLLADAVARAGRIDARAIRIVVGKRLLLTGLPVAATVVLYQLASTDRAVEVPLLFVGTYAGTAVYSTVTSALRAVGRVGVEAGNEVMSRLGVLAVGWLWLAHGGGLRAAVAVYALADVISAVAVLAAARRAISAPVGERIWDNLTLRRALPLALGFALANFYGRIDMWLVARIDGSVSAGRYAAASKILDAILVPSIAVGALVITWTATLHGQSLRRAVVRFSIAAVATSLPSATLAWVTANWTMVTVFGANYAAAVSPLRVLAAAAPSAAVVAALSPLAATRGRGRFSLAVGGALVLNVVLNLMLVPTWGTRGAAFSWLLSQSALALALVVVSLAAGGVARTTAYVVQRATSLAPKDP